MRVVNTGFCMDEPTTFPAVWSSTACRGLSLPHRRGSLNLRREIGSDGSLNASSQVVILEEVQKKVSP